jgi:hypothetical protein
VARLRAVCGAQSWVQIGVDEGCTSGSPANIRSELEHAVRGSRYGLQAVLRKRAIPKMHPEVPVFKLGSNVGVVGADFLYLGAFSGCILFLRTRASGWVLQCSGAKGSFFSHMQP